MSAPHTPPVDSSSTPPGATLKEALASARARLKTATEGAHAGIAMTRRFAADIDALVSRIYQHAGPSDAAPAALVALGGYGRRHQCQWSDIDLLVVFDGRIGAAEERLLRAILHPLWDLGLDVGQQVRELTDFETPETDNPEYLTALLESRLIDGEPTVFRQFEQACLSPTSPWRAPMRQALLDLTHQRHALFNRTVFHLEPDVKDTPGGLRDATAIRLLRRLETRRPDDFHTDWGRIEEAEDFLLRVRSILHLERNRNLNTLNHELQEAVAAVFRAPGTEIREQVEALMSVYYHHARVVSRSLTTLLKTSDAPATVTVTPIDDELERSWDGVRFVDGTRASLQPQIWLRPFEVALKDDLVVSEQVLTCIERHTERYAPERFFPTKVERDRLLRMLRPRPGLYSRLSELHDRGLLGRLFPEFQKVYCQVIRDFYHRYTVDEHTLLTIRNVERLLTPRTSSRKRFAGVLAELAEPELLVVALLFHDVGKWTNKNHSEEGARMAAGALRRIRVPERSTATIEFLIRHHLQMSKTAFRRDIEDPETIAQFARLVGTEERLKLLCLLTLADVDAVGPDVLTPWKEEMLWRLYVDTYNRLTLEYGDDVIDDSDVARADLNRHRPDDISEQELTAFVEGYPHRYLRLVEPARVYEHVRLSRDLDPTDVHVALTETDAAWELSAIAIDQPGLFANVCGVLSYFGTDILRGQAMSNEHGVVLDLFQFRDREDYFRLNRGATDELTTLLRDVVAGRVDIDEKLRGRQLARAARPPVRVPTRVRFNNHYSRRFTVLEIVTEDAWGLLYRISRTLSASGVGIDLVLISTEGTRAIDVFHLTLNGAKLSEDAQHQLEAALAATLQEETDT